MNTLVIASSSEDYNDLLKNKFINDIKSAFTADKVIWCSTKDCLKELSQAVDYILYFNSFKELTYEQVRALAAGSLTVDGVYGVDIKGNKVWLYENGVIADCIEHTSSIGNAIKNAMLRSAQLARTGDKVLAVIVAVIFAVLLATYVDRVTSRTVYAQPQQQETQQVKEKEDNARLPLFFVE